MKDIIQVVEKNRQLILDAERYIWKNPETGFKEFKTSKYMAEQFIALGYDLTYADNITGFYTVLDTEKEGPNVLVLGELDSIICHNHPDSDPETGAVHSCGHNAQCAALLGVAAALKEKSIIDKLCGKITLCAVPAEELLEIEFRSRLKEKGIIKYFGGKAEFLYRGYFDDVDLAFMVHTSVGDEFYTRSGAIGCVAKNIIYKGKSAHAGGSPWDGKNALYAATLGINACNAIRERFKENDVIRFHPIITNGGAIVNAIPESTVLESYVRGKTFEAITSANKQINQALCGAALSIGANVEIIDTPGYAPLSNSKEMINISEQAFKSVYPDQTFKKHDIYWSASTDMGDLSCVMPVVHPYAPGAVGTAHGDDYYIKDKEKACIMSAVWQLSLLTLLLENGGEKAKEVIANYTPVFNSKEEYFAYCDSISHAGDRIKYSIDKIEVEV